MPTSSMTQDLNRELARRIIEEARDNPQSPYRSKFVGIANGRVVVVTDNWDELARLLRQIEPVADNTFCLEVSAVDNAVQEIWELR